MSPLVVWFRCQRCDGIEGHAEERAYQCFHCGGPLVLASLIYRAWGQYQ